MYAETDAVGLAIEAATGVALADRARYEPFMAAAEREVAARRLYIGGDAATAHLLGRPLAMDQYELVVHSPSAGADARALATAMYQVDPAGLGRYTYMQTGTPGAEYTVFVDERPLVRVLGLAVHRGRVADVVVPVPRPAFFARAPDGRPVPQLCLGPEIQLLQVYTALACPGRAGEWPALLEVEDRLREVFLAGFEAAALAAHGGAPPKDRGPAARLRAALAADYIPGAGRVQVGTAERLQVVAAAGLEAEEAAVRKVAGGLGLAVQTTLNDPKVVGDGRLRRLTFYLHTGPRREAVLDVYNAGGHEVVPYVRGPGGGARGTFFVRLRFALVDVWTVQLLHRMGLVSADYTRAALRRLVAEARAVGAEYVAARAAGDYPAIFPEDAGDAGGAGGYAGRYEDPYLYAKRHREEVAAQKGAGKGAGKQKGAGKPKKAFIPNYYPARGAAPRAAD